jgi:nickel/cobalt transporter (NicO) family protein
MARAARGAMAALALLAAAGALCVAAARPALAHPLGNFTVNRANGLLIQPDRLVDDLVLDMAEIPTFQAREQMGAAGGGTPSDAQVSTWRIATCARLVAGLRARLDGRPLEFSSGPSAIAFRPGQGGLPTLRLECSASALTGRAPGAHTLVLTDGNEPGRVGWREMTVAEDGTTVLSSSAPATSPSARLTSYPADLLGSPPDQETATVRYRDGGPRIAAPAGRTGRELPGVALPRGVDRAGRAFAALVASGHLSPALALVAILVAVLLGGIHALAPGHGKTVMSAYLVGLHGSVREAALIGATVTATHTAGVLILGIALEGWSALAPERLYPWFGLASGVLLVCVGVRLLRRALPHRHHDGGHTHDHVHSDWQPANARRTGWRTMLALGFTGGLVPSPSALVVLLGAISIGRAWLGVLLVVAYGAGMALVLIGIGLLLVHARAAVELRHRRWPSHRRLRIASALPVGSAAVILLAGLWLALRGAVQL